LSKSPGGEGETTEGKKRTLKKKRVGGDADCMGKGGWQSKRTKERGKKKRGGQLSKG